MNDAVILMLAVAAGVLLGVAFFGGLWWTVQKSLASKHPALWILSSLVLRTVISLAGLYFVSGGQWDRLLACLLGFVIARFIVTRLVGPRIGPGNSGAKEFRHAP
jgi:F1F0 ATPase subunit 2